MSLENAKDLAAGNTPDLSNTMRVTKDDTDLRWRTTKWEIVR